MFKENLYLYVDKEDSSEFRSLVDLNKTRVFDKKDFQEFYKDRYLPSLSTFSKIYFINFLLSKNLIDDSFYFTDDDILLYNDTFESLKDCKKAVYAKDMILIIDRLYPKWKKLWPWIQKNYNDSHSLKACATNFYFPQRLIKPLSKEFIRVFNEFIDILIEEKDFIDSLNQKSRSLRNRDFSVFYLDTPFFNIVFPRIGIENYQLSQINLCAYSHLRKAKEKINSIEITPVMDKYFSKLKSFPKNQPLLHFSVNNKLPLMIDCYNFMNNQDYKHKNIDEILLNNPREEKKLKSTKTIQNINSTTKPKSLF